MSRAEVEFQLRAEHAGPAHCVLLNTGPAPGGAGPARSPGGLGAVSLETRQYRENTRGVLDALNTNGN